MSVATVRVLLKSVGLLPLTIIAACQSGIADGAETARPKAAGTYEFEGRLVSGFEISAFYPGGDCSASPLWFEDAPGSGLHDRLLEIGFADPEREGSASFQRKAVRIRFYGLLSPSGQYGHKGMFEHKVSVLQILDVAPAETCR